MENMAGFRSIQIPAITPYFSLKIAILAITDIPFLTKMQKEENRRNDSPLDNRKIQVGLN